MRKLVAVSFLAILVGCGDYKPTVLEVTDLKTGKTYTTHQVQPHIGDGCDIYTLDGAFVEIDNSYSYRQIQ